MKRAALVLVFLGCFAGLAAAESNHNVGLGLMLGEPTGLSFKMWNRQTVAFDAGAAWSFVNDKHFQIHGDFLLHNFNLFRVDRGRMALFYGLGARMKFADDLTFSLRIPVGLSYEFERTPVELFIEVVPMIDLIPATEVQMAGALGFRYYF